jgi:thiamine-phosphate pyrophosphorylase
MTGFVQPARTKLADFESGYACNIGRRHDYNRWYSMDARLIAWARAASARRRRDRRLPTLWLFTDARRLPDPRPVAACLPRGLAGVVLRHDGEPGRETLGRDLARICRARRLALVVAGDARLAAALGAGMHLRSGRWPGVTRPGRRLVTSSAHGLADLLRARRAGAALAFLSPTFATASHPEATALGSVRWARLAGSAGLRVAALGGITGASVQRLPVRICHAVGAIGALVSSPVALKPQCFAIAMRTA